MKKSHRAELETIPGFHNDSGALKFRGIGTERIGRDYDQIERRAYPPMSPSAQADIFTQMAEHQNQMFAKLQPKVDEILNDPNDPRGKMMQQLLGMLGGMPAPHDVAAMREDVLAASEISQPLSNYSGIDVDLPDDERSPVEAAKWLSDHFESLIPGFVEVAKYAYSILEEEQMDDAASSAYILADPSEQDYLDRIRILSVEINADRRYVFSLEAPSSHLEEHGMYAVFEECKLIACGGYDILDDLENGAFGDDEE